MSTSGRKTRRPRGSTELLPSGARRVRVYAGKDPISKDPYYLKEIIPAEHPDQDAEVNRVRRKLVAASRVPMTKRRSDTESDT